MNLFVLEDDHDRISRFRAVVSRHHKQPEIRVHRTAPSFIAAYAELSQIPDLICLDHDLFIDLPSDPDPGDGRDVSTFLAKQATSCPILIHSSNVPAADSMLYSLLDAGWMAEKIAPIGSGWIEEYWYPTVCRVVSAKR